MSRKQIAKPVYVNFHFSEREVVEMFLYSEALFAILDNRHMISFHKFNDDELESLIEPIENAYNNRVTEPNGVAVMSVLKKDLTKYLRILKHVQARFKYYTGKTNENIDKLNTLLSC